MLAFCNSCRTTKDIKIQVENPRDKDITGQAICTDCGNEAEINDFVRKEMIRKRDFITKAKPKKFQARCHNCQMEVESKLDKQSNPRCMRCGTKLSLSKLMIKTMKDDFKLFMDEEELDKFSLA